MDRWPAADLENSDIISGWFSRAEDMCSSAPRIQKIATVRSGLFRADHCCSWLIIAHTLDTLHHASNAVGSEQLMYTADTLHNASNAVNNEYSMCGGGSCVYTVVDGCTRHTHHCTHTRHPTPC